MTRRDLAGWLCRSMQARRLARLGEPLPPLDGNALDGLPEAEQENWLDLADVVLELESSNHPIERLQTLGTDWIRYTTQIAHDPEWRDQMRRALVVEMRAEVDKLAEESGL